MSRDLSTPAPAPPARPPSVDALARQLAEAFSLPHPLLVEVSRQAIAASATAAGEAAASETAAAGESAAGETVAAGESAAGDTAACDPAAIAVAAAALAQKKQSELLQPVINATGVLLHTNLARAPLALNQQAGYANLEFNLQAGKRGSRQAAVGQLFAQLSGAQSALVVNNGAAAVLLVLAALASGRGVAVSRGELVEIGGGFRVPEVMSQSGARLVEVGTTNRTRLSDYANAMSRSSADVALLFKVHQSNYTIEGFTELVSVSELAQLGLPVVYDLGSGLLDASCPWLKGGPPNWLASEPAVRQSLADGADLVIFSGDKLLGGPQAGIICGQTELVQLCARHPLARALRPGGHLLAGLQQVALAYLNRDVSQLPFWQLATTPIQRLRQRIEALGLGPPVAMSSVPGGGTLPGVEIPSLGICLDGDFSQKLRSHVPAVIGRVAQGQTYLDFRTVFEHQDGDVAQAVTDCAG